MIERHPLHAAGGADKRQAMPKIWLFSDERLENPLLRVVASLPVGSGIVLRHDGLPQGARWRIARRLMRLAGARGLMVLIADKPAVAGRWGVHGVHVRRGMAHRAGQARALGLVMSMPVHDRAQARMARRCGADMAFISPLYSTRSHRDADGLGMARWMRLAREVRPSAIAALGGMNPGRARALRKRANSPGRDVGWAAIDALDQACSARLDRRRAAMKRV